MRFNTVQSLVPVIGALLLMPAALVAQPRIGGLDGAGLEDGVMRGRVLLSELNCTACHRPEGADRSGGAVAPRLANVGKRVSPAYMERFIGAPQAVEPGTRMPGLPGEMGDAERRSTARALTHYLRSLAKPGARSEGVARGSSTRGRELYFTIGCVACHQAESGADGVAGLPGSGGKYSLNALVEFLKEPGKHRPAGRMPDMKLTHFEAVDVATFLIGDARPSPAPVFDRGLAGQGRRRFGELGCAQCHGDVPAESRRSFTPLGRLRPDAGCLSGQPGEWPDFKLVTRQVAEIRLALAAFNDSLSAENEVVFELTRRNCLACHQRGTIGGPSAAGKRNFTGTDPNLGEQGRLPPPLTGVGAKLKPEWLRKVLVHGESVRPYLKTRMPRFGPGDVERLVGLFGRADELAAAGFERIKDAKQAKADGLRLAGSRGLNCVACHTFRLESAAPIRALDLTTMTERLREDWFHHYLRHPRRFQPLTIMPAFWPDGRAALTSVQEGDAGRQIDALWQYLSYGRNVRAPAGIVLEPLPLVVGEEAVMLRRNYPGIGKRGIGVGYPSGINLAFDAGQMRLGSIWRGEFIEASPAWRGQGSGAVRILSREVVRFPAGPAFAVLRDPQTAWPTNQDRRLPGFQFKGYTLDKLRRPTFRYEFLGHRITDRFADVKDEAGRAYFERIIRIDRAPDAMFFRAAVDADLVRTGKNSAMVGRGLRIRFPDEPTIRGDELLFDLSGRRELRLEYHW